MYMRYSRPNSAATFLSASSMRLRFSGREKSMNGSFTNSETCGFVSAVAIFSSPKECPSSQFYCAPRGRDKASLAGSASRLSLFGPSSKPASRRGAAPVGADLGASWGAAVLRPYEASVPRKQGNSVGLAVEDFGGELLGRGGQRFLARTDRLSGHWFGGRLVHLFTRFIVGLRGNVFRFFVETVEVVVDGFKAAQHEAADVGEDRGLAWRDASLGEQLVQGDQRVTDLLGTLEVAVAVEELRGEVDGLLRRSGSVASTEC